MSPNRFFSLYGLLKHSISGPKLQTKSKTKLSLRRLTHPSLARPESYATRHDVSENEEEEEESHFDSDSTHSDSDCDEALYAYRPIPEAKNEMPLVKPTRWKTWLN